MTASLAGAHPERARQHRVAALVYLAMIGASALGGIAAGVVAVRRLRP